MKPQDLSSASVPGTPTPPVFRVYSLEECGDEYPLEWHRTVKHLVREQAGHRCVRCGHPYRTGEHGKGEWTPCDKRCRHGGPVRWSNGSSWEEYDGPDETIAVYVEAKWRILTVHHLLLGVDAKRDLRWWNLAALCQRCHLTIQGRVVMERIWPWPHSDWFKPYAAGWYAWIYLGEELTRDETMARLDELLALEQAVA